MAKRPSAPRMSATLPDFLPPQLFPFASRWMEVGQHRIHYIDEGKGPVIVFFHGNPAYSFLFRKVIPLLSSRFRCIAMDYPGFGLSKAGPGYGFLPRDHARVMQEFIQKLKLKKFAPAINDWGGPIGLRVAETMPERISALIIGNTFAWPVNGDLHFEGFSRFFGGPIGKWLIRRFNAFVRILIPRGTTKAKLDAREMQAYLGPMPTAESRMPTYILPRAIRKSKEFLEEVHSNLPVLTNRPALILWGDKDIAFRKKERERFEELFSHHQTKILKGAGHFIWEDSPEEIAEAILGFSNYLS